MWLWMSVEAVWGRDWLVNVGTTSSWLDKALSGFCWLLWHSWVRVGHVLKHMLVASAKGYVSSMCLKPFEVLWELVEAVWCGDWLVNVV